MTAQSAPTFDDDCLGLRPFAERLEKFILVERQFVEGGLVLSLGAPFGAGKTTFLRMWKTDLEARRKENQALPRPIVLNAWESDFCGDPLVAIVTGLIEALELNNAGKSVEGATKLREAAKDVVWFATGIANSVVSNFAGVDPIAAGEFAAAKKENRKPQIPDVIRLYQQRVDALQALKELLQKQFGDSAGGAIVMVDELDRCRPDYAISYLETIKHVFNLPSLSFVLAVDYQRIASAASSVFGELNFDEYYRKFVHRTVLLPPPDKEGLAKLARRYASTLLEKESIRVSLLKIENHTIDQIIELLGAFRLTPRQTQEAFRIMGHVLTGDESHRGRVHWCIGVGVMLMAVLRVADRKVYEAIGHGRLPYADFGKLLIERVGMSHAEWWFSIFITGIGDSSTGEQIDLEALYKKLGFVKPDETFERRERLGQVSQGWGYSTSSRILQIYEKIEQVSSL